MPKQSSSTKKTALSALEQYELNQWLEQNHVSSSNLRRSFTDVLPLARLLAPYYPELIDLNYYPPRNSVQNKLHNWEAFNKRVLTRLGVSLSREQMVRVARSVPGSVDLLLYTVMQIQMAAERKEREQRDSTDDDEEARPEREDEDEAAQEADTSETRIFPVAGATKGPKTVEIKANAQRPKTLKQAQAMLKRSGGMVGTARVSGAGATTKVRSSGFSGRNRKQQKRNVP